MYLTVIALACVLSLPNAILAVPDIKVARLTNSCTSYPSFNNATNEAGPWVAIAESTGNAIDGLEVSAESFTNDGIDRFGFITLPKTRSPPIQNITMRCAHSTLQASIDTGDEAGSTWKDLVIAADENWQASFGFGLEPSVPVEPYAHYRNGTRVSGVFLGAGGSTSWRFKFNWGGNAGEYYLVRLLGVGEVGGIERRQGPVVDDRDYTGFLRVGG